MSQTAGSGGVVVFTLDWFDSPEGQEKLHEAPKYLEKIEKIIVEEGGILEDVYAVMGPWDFFAIVKYPDNETAFRVLARIGMLEVVKTETFPAEKVDVFLKALV
jgi:uncharacterized protein with GYD domain